MTAKQFYDWQTSGGTNDVMKMVNCLETADIEWCIIGGIAVNHWAEHPMVTLDVDFVVATPAIGKAVATLEDAGFESSEFEWSINFKGSSAISLQLSTESFYKDYCSKAVAADVHGVLLRVASLEDTLRGKIKAWSTKERRQSKRIKDLADITRLVETHSALWLLLPDELKALVDQPQ